MPRMLLATAEGLDRPGELGWSTAKTELKLGTLVGTGSYGIVREAELEGLQVSARALILHLANTVSNYALKIPSGFVSFLASFGFLLSATYLWIYVSKNSLIYGHKTA